MPAEAKSAPPRPNNLIAQAGYDDCTSIFVVRRVSEDYILRVPDGVGDRGRGKALSIMHLGKGLKTNTSQADLK